MKASIGPYNQGKKRTCKIKFSAYDCWNLDDTFSRIIVSGLRLFRKREHPGIGNAFYDEKLPDEGFGLWMAALDKMIWSFEQNVTGDEEPTCPSPIKPSTWKPFGNDGSWEMIGGEYEEGVIEKWHEDRKAYEAKVQEGIDLFAKHFRDLWE